jgi:hypothetical protein
MILEIERAIVDRLKTALSPLPVDPLPARGYRFTHAHGAAVVLASRLTASEVRDTRAAIQEAELVVEIALYARSLRDGAGVWPMFEAARRALLSWTPAPGATPLRLAEARLADMEDGVWALACEWRTRIAMVPDLEAGAGPLLSRVTFEEV